MLLPTPLVLPASLVIDTIYSWARMLIALFVSMVLGLIIGIMAARSERLERVLLPVIDIFQTLPILAFFPFAIFVIVSFVPGSAGVNIAVVFLIITSMLWNIIFGVYEAIKTLPVEIMEVMELYKMSLWTRFTKVYLPAALPKMSEQSALSWAVGLFYLVTSEIFSAGPSSYQVTNGIGVALTHLAVAGNLYAYALGLLIFLFFVVATRYLLFVPFSKYANRWGASEMKHQRDRIRAGISGPIHKIRMLNEIEHVYYKEETRIERFGRRMAERLGMSKKPDTPIVRQASSATGARRLLYVTYAAAIMIVVFYFAGFLNAGLAGEEYLSLISLAYTFARVWLVFIAIIVVSIPLCVYLVFMRKDSESYVGLFQILASIPATIVLPLIVYLLAGSPYHQELVAGAVLFLSGIWYVVFSTMSGSRTLQSSVMEVKNVFGIKGWAAWKKIYIMAILPGIVTGAVTGIAAEWNATIVAEYFTSSGVGPGTVLSSVNVGIGKLLDLSLSCSSNSTVQYAVQYINGTINCLPSAVSQVGSLIGGNFQLMVIALINLTVMIILINTFVWRKLYRNISRVYK